MRGEPEVIDYLNKSLRHEMTAVNQYWLHYRLLEIGATRRWPSNGARNDRGDAERRQADRAHHLPRRLSQYAGARPAAYRPDVKEVLDCDLAAEISARTLYQEAATHCHSVRDYVSRDLFEKLMHDEEDTSTSSKPSSTSSPSSDWSSTPSIISANSRTRRSDCCRDLFGGMLSLAVTR